MSELFIVSDTHFFHRNIIKFTREDGSKIRDFETLDDMHQHIITKWNSVVSKTDVVWHLGDVSFGSSKNLEILNELNGIKNLVPGNHDHHRMETYYKYFNSIFSSFSFDRYLLTHYPIHRSSLFDITCNIHGHTHEKNVMEGNLEFLWYFNVSLENIDYTPINFTVLKEKIAENKKLYIRAIDSKVDLEYTHYS